MNAKNAKGETVLHEYIRVQDDSLSDLSFLMLSSLFECGVDPRITDSFGKTALDYLLIKHPTCNSPEMPKIAKLFASKGCKSSHPAFMAYLSLPDDLNPQAKQGSAVNSKKTKASSGPAKADYNALAITEHLNFFVSEFTNSGGQILEKFEDEMPKGGNK